MILTILYNQAPNKEQLTNSQHSALFVFSLTLKH